MIRNKHKTESSALEPDTIMKYNGCIYILDAKYYKYGVTGNAMHLPGTSSIQKQITYGEYVEHNKDNNGIYNAFIMPFDCNGESEYKFVSVGTVDWKEYNDKTEDYYYVLGILLDTRHLLEMYAKHNQSEIQRLSELIETSLCEYRNNI